MDRSKLGAHPQHVGRAISIRRVESGLSQAELGEKLRIAEATVERIERGVDRPSPQLLLAVANVLNGRNPVILRHVC